MAYHKYFALAVAAVIAGSFAPSIVVDDSITTAPNSIPATLEAINRLTDDDYARVAGELGVEIAAIKAVSEIEAGKHHHGFVAVGCPTLNFSVNMFNRNLKRRGITVSASQRKREAAFLPLNRKKYGSYGAAQHARLNSAMAIDSVAAITSCYWGMFQIGGFNWKHCGCSSPHEFARLMSQSESMQLELFAQFISRHGAMLKHLKDRNWYAFARIYNGSKRAKSYASRMANAYARYSKQQ